MQNEHVEHHVLSSKLQVGRISGASIDLSTSAGFGAICRWLLQNARKSFENGNFKPVLADSQVENAKLSYLPIIVIIPITVPDLHEDWATTSPDESI